MATKWAIQNGNWSDDSTWNDGVVPVAGDYVYLDGYTVYWTSSINIGNGTISNDTNPNTSNSGGNITTTDGLANNTIITANLIAAYDLVIFTNLAYSKVASISINGNCEVHNFSTLVMFTTTYTGGTVYGVNIVGECKIDQNCTLFKRISANTPYIPVAVNGVLDISGVLGSHVSSDIDINGKLIVRNYNMTATSDGVVSINGAIEYENNTNKTGIDNSALSIAHLTSWKDITTPRVNDFFIVTNDELNNRQQYPAESDVRDGVEYGYGLKEGNYTPNFPQESTVLKDVEYDNGNKVGTLEVIALSGATATAENISVVNLTEQEVERVKNCATVSTVQQCFEDFKE